MTDYWTFREELEKYFPGLRVMSFCGEEPTVRYISENRFKFYESVNLPNSPVAIIYDLERCLEKIQGYKKDFKDSIKLSIIELLKDRNEYAESDIPYLTSNEEEREILRHLIFYFSWNFKFSYVIN